jgi:hypothetical protein
MSLARFALAAVGVVTIGLALAGGWYNFGSIRADFSTLPRDLDAPYLYQALYSMSALCVAFYVFLFYVGIQFIPGRTDKTQLFVLVLVAEMLYFLAAESLWMMPRCGMSIAAATGVANGGLMFQALLLYPLWAPVIAYLAARQLKQETMESQGGSRIAPSHSRQL